MVMPDIYSDDGKPVYNHKPIDNDSIEPNQECSQCDIEYTCFDCEIDQIRTRYPDARYVDSDEWVVPINVRTKQNTRGYVPTARGSG